MTQLQYIHSKTTHKTKEQRFYCCFSSQHNGDGIQVLILKRLFKSDNSKLNVIWN